MDIAHSESNNSGIPLIDESNIDLLYSFDFGSVNVGALPEEEQRYALDLFNRMEQLRKEYNVRMWFPETGPFARAEYPKHMEFFKAGATKHERLFLAGNRCGKSVTAAVEMSFHATGLYPEWWEGHRFKRGITIYAAGKTAKNTRDICQFKLLGAYNALGTGTIPKHTLLGDPVAKPGVPQAYELVHIKHTSGSISTIYFKSYDQGQEAFMGTEVDLAWEDEEPPLDVHSETLTRLMTTNGLLMLTFTPLEGMTDVVLSYLTADLLPDTSRPHVHVTTCGWDDVPHLNAQQKSRLLSSTPPHLRKARSEGIPSIGSGAIYPVARESLEVDDFPIPDYWPRLFALDVGWKRTATLWGALDRDSDTLYLYNEYYKGEESPAVHAQAIKARGAWIPGVCDFHGTNQDDGTRMMDQYVGLGLDLVAANKAVEAGVFEVWQRVVEGRLKIFKSLQNFWAEFGLYRRDEKGKIVKKNDHLMDDMRYMCMSIELARNKPVTLLKKRNNNNMKDRWAM